MSTNYKSNVFRIVSQWQATTNPYYLTAIDLQNHPRLAISTSLGPETRFTLEYRLFNSIHGFRLHCTGNRVVCCGTSEGDPVTLVDDSIIDGYTVLCLGTSDGGYYALRPTADTGLNLNVKGGGTYSNGQPIIMYPWKGGRENMRWKLDELSYSAAHTIKPVGVI